MLGGVSLLRLFGRLSLVSLSLRDPSFDCKQGPDIKKKSSLVYVVDVTSD